MRTQLELRQLELNVSIGCLAEEKKILQPIELSVSIQFANPPLALKNDELSSTLCYGMMTDRLKEICHSKHFNTVEHMAWHCWQGVAKILGPEDFLELEVHKTQPPLSIKNRGAFFRVTGFASELTRDG